MFGRRVEVSNFDFVRSRDRCQLDCRRVEQTNRIQGMKAIRVMHHGVLPGARRELRPTDDAVPPVTSDPNDQRG